MTHAATSLKLVFCGTPEFGVPTLRAVLDAGHEVALVVSQPDRPIGREQRLTAPPVKQTALAAGLAVTQPEKIRSNAEFRAQLEAIAPDAIVVVAYGRIIPPWMLALPRLGCINLHASLLPKYRGAAPIQWAIATGDAYTGNTTMLLEEGLDTGPILLQRTIEIGPDQTATELFPVMAEAGAPMVVETLAGLAAGTIHPQPQGEEGTTFAPLLNREDGRMDFAGAHRARALQSLARISALARRIHCAQWEEVDCSSHGDLPFELRRGIGLCRAGVGSGREWAHAGVLRRQYVAGASRDSAGRQKTPRCSGIHAWESACGGCAAGLSAVSTISPSRRAAFEILMAVERGNAHADELLRRKAVDKLSAADRNLTTALVLGVLRWQIRLDHEIKRLLKRPNAKLDAEVLIALRLGAFQLRFLERIPAHAAIDESVELTKESGHRFGAGMVNAVLRAIARAATPLQDSEKNAAELALTQAHPSWMVERWVDFYGLGEARAICRHGQKQPPLTVRLRNAEAEVELAREGIGLEPGTLLTAARTVTSGDAAVAFGEGRLRIQDEGSQLIGELAACVGVEAIHPGKEILDACAAPGGKTLILAERNPEARIVACESNARRLADLRERVAPFAGRIDCRQADATELIAESAFDVALADVPCSGTGTLGRNPEIRHRLRLEDLARHTERQRAILRSALRAVRPSGYVVYSTCSLEPEENERVVEAVLAETQNAAQASMAPSIELLHRRRILTPRRRRAIAEVRDT